MAEKRTAPPVFNGVEGENYLDWKLDFQCWEDFTEIEQKKRATRFLLELKEGKVKDLVRSLETQGTEKINVRTKVPM